MNKKSSARINIQGGGKNHTEEGETKRKVKV